jgi:leucine-rich repeat protein SHOC2
LPENIGNLFHLNSLDLSNNQLTNLPESIGKLDKLPYLNLSSNQLTSLPESIGNLFRLKWLSIQNNKLDSLPKSIGNLAQLTHLDLDISQLNSLQDELPRIINLTEIHLYNDRPIGLPENIKNLAQLTNLYIYSSSLTDLSVLQKVPNLINVHFLNVRLPRQYWTRVSDWKPEWLLQEDNVEIRSTLIEQLGYEKICQKLNAITINIWREYTLLRIDRVEPIYDLSFYPVVGELINDRPIDYEAMLLLKMICPSTGHIHILRVPPEMMSAEEAITWVNSGIHPDQFAVQA